MIKQYKNIVKKGLLTPMEFFFIPLYPLLK